MLLSNPRYFIMGFLPINYTVSYNKYTYLIYLIGIISEDYQRPLKLFSFFIKKLLTLSYKDGILIFVR